MYVVFVFVGAYISVAVPPISIVPILVPDDNDRVNEVFSLSRIVIFPPGSVSLNRCLIRLPLTSFIPTEPNKPLLFSNTTDAKFAEFLSIFNPPKVDVVTERAPVDGFIVNFELLFVVLVSFVSFADFESNTLNSASAVELFCVTFASVNFAPDGTSTATVWPFTFDALPFHTTALKSPNHFAIFPNDVDKFSPDVMLARVEAFVNVTFSLTSLKILLAIFIYPPR